MLISYFTSPAVHILCVLTHFAPAAEIMICVSGGGVIVRDMMSDVRTGHPAGPLPDAENDQ